jgi:thiol-disulfide isomerase/thioredoxin
MGEPGGAAVEVRITVLTAPGCPFCQSAVRLVERYARDRPEVKVAVHDVSEVPDLAARLGVKSVPTIVVADDVALIGAVTPERLAEVVAAVGTPAFATERLRTCIDSRRLDEVVAFLRAGADLEAIIPLLRDGDLSLRVAVLLAVEQAAAASPGCLGPLVPHLVTLLEAGDARLRGDIADLLGTIAAPQALPPLRALLGDPDGEVAAAAADALARIGIALA